MQAVVNGTLGSVNLWFSRLTTVHNGLPSPEQMAPAVRGGLRLARETLCAIQRTLGRCVLFALPVIEVEIGQTHRPEVETSLGTAITPALRLSSMALVWLQEAAFELPSQPRAR